MRSTIAGRINHKAHKDHIEVQNGTIRIHQRFRGLLSTLCPL